MVTPIKDKVALVTGAGQGIDDVAINDLPHAQAKIDAVVQEITALGRRSIGVTGDVSDFEQTEALMAKVVEGLGRLDTVIANAGVLHIKPLLETTVEDRRKIVNVNIEGVMNTYISAGKVMKEAGRGGRIIGAASVLAYDVFPLLGFYSMSKFAVRGITQAAAKEFAQYGIRVNAYAPGMVDTPMQDQIAAGLSEATGASTEDVAQKIVGEMILLKRPSVPEDVAKTVSFLASEDAEYITGQTILCDGGIRFA